MSYKEPRTKNEYYRLAMELWKTIATTIIKTNHPNVRVDGERVKSVTINRKFPNISFGGLIRAVFQSSLPSRKSRTSS